MSISKESLPFVVILLGFGVIFYFLFIPIAVVMGMLLVFVLFFFRDPHRISPDQENLIVSPADGKVVAITEMEETSFIDQESIKISIFLSVFNVHINRAPVCGEVRAIIYKPGKFISALKSQARNFNEKNIIHIENKSIKIIVHQIAGIIARRIVWWISVGQKLNKGEKFGMIRFGSCTEIILPKDKVTILVKPGSKVKGAKTIIGVIKEEV